MEGLPLEPVKALLRDLEQRRQPWAVVIDNTYDRYTPYCGLSADDPHNYMNTLVGPVDIESLQNVYKSDLCAGKGRKVPCANPWLASFTFYRRYLSCGTC